jgi:hypothetical protein
MFKEVDPVIEEALHLAPDDRIRVADKLYGSVPDDDVKRAWLDEAKQRIDEYRRGEAVLIDPAETFSKTKKMIAEARRSKR